MEVFIEITKVDVNLTTRAVSVHMQGNCDIIEAIQKKLLEMANGHGWEIA